MRALIKYPGKAAIFKDIKGTLQELQETVGGHIETVTLTSDCVIICNEDGLITGLPYNCDICGINFVGPIVLLGRKGDSFADFSWTTEEVKDIGLMTEKDKPINPEVKMDNKGWIRAEDKLPEDNEEVLVIASGNVNGKPLLVNAYMLAAYYKDEGFILEEFPEAENLTVNWWIPLPEPPEEAL